MQVRPTGIATLDAPEPEAESVCQGLDQLTRYLGRAWARAGSNRSSSRIARKRFMKPCSATWAAPVSITWPTTSAATAFARCSIATPTAAPTSSAPWTWSRSAPSGSESFQSLDDHYADLADSAGGDGASAADWRCTLDEAIDRTLSTREAALIRETLLGKTPAEIAATWGVAPKTISNEKTRAIQKLRVTLTDDLAA